MKHTLAALIFLFFVHGCVLGIGQDQLYTGDASTVKPGHYQFQVFYNKALEADMKIAGGSLFIGATRNFDAKISYGYLWGLSQDIKMGPTIGAKWRFLGDGTRKGSSMALSVLGSLSGGTGNDPNKRDFGALFIAQQPTPIGIILANFGHVWVGDDLPDLRYMAFALARFVTPQVLVAAQYIDVDQMGFGPAGRQVQNYVGAVVYRPQPNMGYSLQIGYSPISRVSNWNMTLSLSVLF